MSDRQDLAAWLTGLLTIGSARNDAVPFAEGRWRSRNGGDLTELADLGEAMAGSAKRHPETMRQRAAFQKAARAWPDAVFARLPEDCPLPVAAGALSDAHDIPLAAALPAYLHAFVSNQLQAAQRLMALGQQASVKILASLEDPIGATARHAAGSTLDDPGSATMAAEIASLRHETRYSRLF